jgi:hypothetical protein
MQRAAAACAGRCADVDADLFARQMIGKRLAPRLPVLLFGARLLLCFGTRFVGLNVLQSKRELIGIDALGSAAKPRSLKLFDLSGGVFRSRRRGARRPKPCRARGDAAEPYRSEDY